VRLYRQAIDRRAVIVSDNSRSIPCISCEGAGIAGKDLWISKMKRHVVIVKVQVWSL